MVKRVRSLFHLHEYAKLLFRRRTYILWHIRRKDGVTRKSMLTVSRVQPISKSKNGQSSNNSSKTANVVTCSRCTLRGYNSSQCHTKCRRCHREGHIAKDCNKGKKLHTLRNEETEISEESAGNSTEALARSYPSYIWFQGLDAEIEGTVKHCEACQLHQKNP